MAWNGTHSRNGVTIIFAPPPANIRYVPTVLIHNSGYFGPPLPTLPGLPMASYATALPDFIGDATPVSGV